MNRSRVLIVDDEPRNIRLLAPILSQAGHEILQASGGEEACRRVNEEKPDIVLLDAMMPGMSGFDVCAWIRGRADTQLLPVVMVTALNATEEKVRALETGADDFLSKPINRLELLAKVRSLLRVRALQEDLARKNEELKRVESQRESLIQMIVHDLKNPLAGIQGYAELLARSQPADAADARRLTSAIRSSCRTMMDMILDMLDIGRMEEGCSLVQAEAFDIEEVIARDVEECLGQARAAGVDLVVEMSGCETRAHADAGLVRRVIANLLNNALKHTPPGGRVTVGARAAADLIEVRVGDTGEGIPADELERIFDKFARVSGQRFSTRHDRGLGLTFCRMAVEAHGGSIRVESEPGRGSVFTFSLPAARVPAGQAASVPA